VREKADERCLTCSWKTVVGDSILVCSFPKCPYADEREAVSPNGDLFSPPNTKED